MENNGKRRRRTTVQLGQRTLEAVQKLAVMQGSSHSGAVREALAWYVGAVDRGEDLPPPAFFDVPRRIGRHGPATRWDGQISVVLDDELAERLTSLAGERGVSLAHIAREAIGCYLSARAITPGPFRSRPQAGLDSPPVSRRSAQTPSGGFRISK